MQTPITVIIPTYNAGESFYECARMLVNQMANIKQVLIIDSESNDTTAKIAKDFGFTVETINKKDFGHGKTRQYAIEKTNTEIVVFLTQDALLYNENSIELIVKYLNSDSKLGAVYGRQLPYPSTGILGEFARLYNYPDFSKINVLADKEQKGIKTAFLSDSFAAYKKEKLFEIGGFPKHLNFGEDMYVAAKLLLAGYHTGYCAEAKVYHSHDFSLQEEFNRSKEIGKFHKQEKWLLDTFGKAEGEGVKFVINEAKYLIKNSKYQYLPLAFIHNIAKIIGYKIGSYL